MKATVCQLVGWLIAHEVTVVCDVGLVVCAVKLLCVIASALAILYS